MTKLNWINKIIFAINVMVGLLLVIATFSPLVAPASLGFVYMIGLAYPLLLIINIIFIFYWLYQHKIYFLWSVLIIAMGISNISTLIAFNTKDGSPEKSEFTVMSFNVRLFNEFRWIEDENLDERILNYISEQSPDVIAFQEFINKNKPELRFIDKMKALGYRYHKVEPRGESNKMQNFFGLATFSKYKIIDSGAAFRYPEDTFGKTASLYTDIQVNKQVIRVYNTHLNSLKFISEDYKFVENLTESNDPQALKKSKNIISKVLVSAEKRQKEVSKISTHIKDSPYPVILTGDFNEPPYSYAYEKLTTNLADAFLDHGVGLGTTYDGISTIPGLRLDFMLYSKDLVSDNFKTGTKNLSDHRPLMGWFHFKQLAPAHSE